MLCRVFFSLKLFPSCLCPQAPALYSRIISLRNMNIWPERSVWSHRRARGEGATHLHGFHQEGRTWTRTDHLSPRSHPPGSCLGLAHAPALCFCLNLSLSLSVPLLSHKSASSSLSLLQPRVREALTSLCVSLSSFHSVFPEKEACSSHL